ncbi:hypothetical protein [Streptomyces sp. NPDC018610]|uniref:hypothetical protein n=1 Tax=Streptomyces sp. NPDC018610 TaxID=3365049 RepID=UPI00379D9181
MKQSVPKCLGANALVAACAATVLAGSTVPATALSRADGWHGIGTKTTTFDTPGDASYEVPEGTKKLVIEVWGAGGTGGAGGAGGTGRREAGGGGGGGGGAGGGAGAYIKCELNGLESHERLLVIVGKSGGPLDVSTVRGQQFHSGIEVSAWPGEEGQPGKNGAAGLDKIREDGTGGSGGLPGAEGSGGSQTTCTTESEEPVVTLASMIAKAQAKIDQFSAVWFGPSGSPESVLLPGGGAVPELSRGPMSTSEVTSAQLESRPGNGGAAGQQGAAGGDGTSGWTNAPGGAGGNGGNGGAGYRGFGGGGDGAGGQGGWAGQANAPGSSQAANGKGGDHTGPGGNGRVVITAY